MTIAREHDGFDLDYIEMYVEDLDAARATWRGQYGFAQVAASGTPDAGFRSAVLRRGRMSLALTEPTSSEHPAAGYLKAHGDGIADIALRTTDVRGAYDAIVAAGGSGLAEPRQAGQAWTAKVSGFGDVVHTLIQRDEADAGIPLGYQAPGATVPGSPDGFEVIAADHFAVVVPPEELDSTIGFYQRALGFGEIYDERIVIGSQAMLSKVVQSASRTVTFTVLAPDPGISGGQINEFLASHGGAGVQHVALAVDDIVGAVGTLAQRGVEFLATPRAYYARLAERVSASRHEVERLRELNVLADEDHGGQLFQIFTRSAHPRGTLFFEVIERHGARSFGSANIRALYEAVEGARASSS